MKSSEQKFADMGTEERRSAEQLDALYREGAEELPGEAVDSRILEMARQGLGQPKVHRPWWRANPLAISSAASLLLVVALVWLNPAMQGGDPLPLNPESLPLNPEPLSLESQEQALPAPVMSSPGSADVSSADSAALAPSASMSPVAKQAPVAARMALLPEPLDVDTMLAEVSALLDQGDKETAGKRLAALLEAEPSLTDAQQQRLKSLQQRLAQP
ncbi:hypothetical protein [Shewanella sedimentimangrovi]|uniref:Anti-sigma factor n=1 Tax=Shewanella sedimentimangrovi TaxID=2814293 RepID=A0ABX7QXG3_9GAMM|nr:hypothetical protein [Shewanella sedimentimangrovi]QSX36212.1 hypothetical protein JYB85_12840 [Shewanella sedimentimangrovi]